MAHLSEFVSRLPNFYSCDSDLGPFFTGEIIKAMQIQ